MFLVKLIDIFVGALEFLFGFGRRQNTTHMPLVLGTIGIVVLIVGLTAAISIPSFWYQARTEPFTAEFANAAGLAVGDPVYVAGVPAGRVENIVLTGRHVDVEFRLDDDRTVGNTSTASVRLETVLGKRYLDVRPSGVDDGGNTIPIDRTTVPYSLDEVGAGAQRVSQELDLDAMEQMMTTLSQVMPSDSGEIERTLTGISAASSAFGRHSDQFDQLLEMSRRLSEMAVAQQDLVVETAVDARTLVQTMAVRKEALTGLANNLRAVITTLSQTFTENRDEADRLVANLTAVTATLQRNSENIASLMTQLPPALRTVTDATGNGTWADVTTPAAVLPDNLLCAIGVMQECR
ncbi:MCE family protein [Rhodococcus sp. HNM0563]|uniref:MCE family protein n=1 Tax=Rhodococcus sp. HNM0563 TaxID=2716339 RepID=UPI00146D0C5B|nr:MCE family protein [Rhodococcus sp. HNM0563]NLU62081.1 MCE family protein [Rhodococcus sp. HNM0563]